MPLSHLFGNAHVQSTLSAFILGDKIPSVLLFSGHKGTGKASFARAFAIAIFGERYEEKVKKLIHPDLIWMRPEGKTYMHSIASVEAMMQDLLLPPFEAKKKICVIEDAERMTSYSSNALLKSLEEPPSYVHFILLVTRIEEVLATIRSRCMCFPFYPVIDEEIARFLQETHGVAEDKAKKIALISKGSFEIALQYLSQEKEEVRSQFIELLCQFFGRVPSLPFFQQTAGLDKRIGHQMNEEGGSTLMEDLLEEYVMWVRDLHYMQEYPMGDNLYHMEYRSALEAQISHKIPSLEKAHILCEQYRIASQKGIKPQVIFERIFVDSIQHQWT